MVQVPVWSVRMIRQPDLRHEAFVSTLCDLVTPTQPPHVVVWAVYAESRLMLPSVRADNEGGNNIVQVVRGLLR